MTLIIRCIGTYVKCILEIIQPFTVLYGSCIKSLGIINHSSLLRLMKWFGEMTI